jgi:hypothetical protein
MEYIKFAGLASEWDSEYAKTYADKLHEMGFFAKALKFKDFYVVAYAHKSFTRDDADRSFRAIVAQNDEGEPQKEGE